jgi:peroxiredoxin
MVRNRLYSTFFPVASFLAAILVVLLAKELREVRGEYGAVVAQARFLEAGTFVPEFRGRALTGERVIIAAEGDHQPRLLFLFNTSCPHCEASVPAWQRIAELVRRDSLPEVVGISTDAVEATQQYASRHRLKFPSVTLEGPRAMHLYRASIVPQTVIVGKDGRVVYARVGRLDSEIAIDSVVDALRRERALAP